MNQFAASILDQLPAPRVVEALDFETIFAQRLDAFKALWPQYSSIVETDPIYLLLQENAYRELHLRQRVNEAALAVMIGHALDSDLDNLLALLGVRRLVIAAGDPVATPPIDAVFESDDAFRRRGVLALEASATAGAAGSYVFHSLSADPRVVDVAVDAPTFVRHSVPPELQAQLPEGAFVLSCNYSAGLTDPMPGDVAVAVLCAADAANDEVVAKVASALSADTVRPITDNPRPSEATNVDYTVDAKLVMYPGPQGEVAFVEAKTALEAYVAANRRLGYDVTRSGLIAALRQAGVQDVILVSPATNIVVDRASVATCTLINLSHGGVNV